MMLSEMGAWKGGPCLRRAQGPGGRWPPKDEWGAGEEPEGARPGDSGPPVTGLGSSLG